MEHTHAFVWSEMHQQYFCSCGEMRWPEKDLPDTHHIVYVFRGHECLAIDAIPYSTLNEAKDHADWLRGDEGKTTDICFVFQVNIDEQGDTFTTHHPRYRATL